MQNSTTHMLNAKWRPFISAILALALMFFTPSFASAANVSQPMPASHSVETSSVSQNHMNSHEDMQMTDNHDCCENEDTPCENNNCDAPCMNTGVPHAVLTPTNSTLYAQNVVINPSNYNIKAGISDRLTAPPPRA
jgi:hypothetical protein